MNQESIVKLNVELINVEKALKEEISETFSAEGFSENNQVQRLLLEIIKEQIIYEHTHSTTR